MANFRPIHSAVDFRSCPNIQSIKAFNEDGSKGEYFTPETVLESKYTKTGTLYVDWEHSAGELGDELLGVGDWKTAYVDDKGVFVERVLNRSSEYVRWIEELIELAISDKQPYSWRPAWLLWSCMDENDQRVQKHIPDIIHSIIIQVDLCIVYIR